MQSRRPEENRARSECHVSRNPPPYSWTTLRLRPGLRPPKHPMSAGEPLDTSLGIDVFIRPTQPSALTLLQRVESHPRPAPQEFSLCPKFAFWPKERWPCSFRPPGRRGQASGFQTRETFLSLSVAPTPTPCLGSEPRMRGAGLAPQLPGRGRQPAQHVAHVSVPLPTPSARLSPSTGLWCCPCASLPSRPRFGLPPPRSPLPFSQISAMCTISVSLLQFSANI